MKKTLFSLCLVACLAVPCVQHAQAATIPLNPVADGWAYNTLDTTGLLLSVNPIARAALEFDISAVPSGITIQSATLYLSALFSSGNIGVYGYVGNGVITMDDITDNSPLETTTFIPAEGANLVDVTAFVSSRFTNGDQYAGFQLRYLADVGYNFFRSSENSSAEYMPRLDIEYAPAPVPEPSTMLLLGSGLVGLVGYGRRRFKK